MEVQRSELPDVPPVRGDWEYLLRQYDWPIAEAERVMMGPTPPNRDAPNGCPNGESGGNPNARNGTNIGLFQINIAAHPYTVDQMLDPVQNIAAAYAIWADSGWGPWSCRP